MGSLAGENKPGPQRWARDSTREGNRGRKGKEDPIAAFGSSWLAGPWTSVSPQRSLTSTLISESTFEQVSVS